MKKLFIAMICLACAGTIQAQDQKTLPSSQEQLKNPKAPKFDFMGGNTHDFGTVKEGPQAEYVFEFKNNGKEPLIIQNASASCGCTTPEWPKEPILPGKKGKITVRYNTQGRVGPFNKTVFLTSNAAGEKDRYELFIKGNVEGSGVKMEDDKK